jgi:hypothetical protein
MVDNVISAMLNAMRLQTRAPVGEDNVRSPCGIFQALCGNFDDDEDEDEDGDAGFLGGLRAPPQIVRTHMRMHYPWPETFMDENEDGDEE